MLMRRTPRFLGSKALYSPTSTLPRDFYHCCQTYFGITLHEETYIGVRASQVRGIFLSPERSFPLPANSPIATIPLASLYTASNISQKPNTLSSVTLDNVRDAIPDDEFKVMAPQLLLALQLSAIIAALPDITQAKEEEEFTRMSEILRGGASPWARMLDDEDFNEEFVLGMYGMALDSWQRQSYDDLTKRLHMSLSAIHGALEPPFKLEHFRRITRLVLARAEHVPPVDIYRLPLRVRRLVQWYRHWRGTRDATVVSLVPLLDLVNHSNRPNCAVRVGPSSVLNGRPAITLYSLSRLQPGQELCRHYNFALDRANALFRYGFLPFDLISIVDHDAVDEYLVSNQHMLSPESEEKLAVKRQEASELKRLERLFQHGRRRRPAGNGPETV